MKFTIPQTLQSEEAVMCPAAILVGQVVRQRLGLRAVALA